jgi:hypothetical protein
MMLALLVLTAVQEPDFTSRPVCDDFRQEHGRCEAGLREVERAEELNAQCGRQVAGALARRRRPDVSARGFAAEMGAVSARCSRERADCIATSLVFSNHFTLSERMRVERAVENCEDRFWQAVIVRSGAPGRSYRDVSIAIAPDQ